MTHALSMQEDKVQKQLCLNPGHNSSDTYESSKTPQFEPESMSGEVSVSHALAMQEDKVQKQLCLNPGHDFSDTYESSKTPQFEPESLSEEVSVSWHERDTCHSYAS